MKQSGAWSQDWLWSKVRRFEARRSLAGGPIYGRTPTPGDISLISSDYLCLAGHAARARADLNAAAPDNMMSAVFLNEQSGQRSFERRLAEFLGCEDVVLSQSGWCANVGLIQAIADRETPVYLDIMAHMSLWEGARSANAPIHPFHHNDPDSLQKRIARHGPGVVVFDSIYSTDGSIAPVSALLDVAHGAACLTVIDDSHALGAHGPDGRGLAVEGDPADGIRLRTASLAKAFAGRGGMVAGPRRLMDYVRHTARPAIFSANLLSHDIAGFGAVLDRIRSDQWRRDRLAANTKYLRRGLADSGIDVSPNGTQIIALQVGDEPGTFALRDALERKGVLGSIFIAPATPANGPLLRLSVNCALQQDELDHVIAACANALTPSRGAAKPGHANAAA